MFPKIKSIQPLEGKKLLVTFDNDVKKIYDCASLLSEDAFYPLEDEALFRNVKIDPGGYGISWNEEIDLSEAELWINGILVEQLAETDR